MRRVAIQGGHIIMFEQLHAYCRQCAVNVAVHLLRWGAGAGGARARLTNIKCQSANELVQLLLMSHQVEEEWKRQKAAHAHYASGDPEPRSGEWTFVTTKKLK